MSHTASTPSPAIEDATSPPPIYSRTLSPESTHDTRIDRASSTAYDNFVAAHIPTLLRDRTQSGDAKDEDEGSSSSDCAAQELISDGPAYLSQHLHEQSAKKRHASDDAVDTFEGAAYPSQHDTKSKQDDCVEDDAAVSAVLSHVAHEREAKRRKTLDTTYTIAPSHNTTTTTPSPGYISPVELHIAPSFLPSPRAPSPIHTPHGSPPTSPSPHLTNSDEANFSPLRATSPGSGTEKNTPPGLPPNWLDYGCGNPFLDRDIVFIPDTPEEQEEDERVRREVEALWSSQAQ